MNKIDLGIQFYGWIMSRAADFYPETAIETEEFNSFIHTILTGKMMQEYKFGKKNFKKNFV